MLNQSTRLLFRKPISLAVSHGSFLLIPLLLSLFLIVPSSLHAQELERIEPRAVPESVKPPVRTPSSSQEESNTHQLGNKELGVKLRGITFLSRREQVDVNGIPVNEDLASNKLIVESSFVPALQDPGFTANLDKYTNSDLSFVLLEELKSMIADFFSSIGRPYVAVSIPPQDISSGMVQLVVIESRMGEVEVEENRWFRKEHYLSQFRSREGEEILASLVNEDIDWLNRNPFRSVDVIARAGETIGTTDMTLIAQERFPLRVYAGFDNYGTNLSGKHRYLAGFNWGNAFNLDHQLNYQHTRSTEGDLSRGHAGSYVMALPWRHMLSFSAAYSRSRPDIAQPFEAEGKAWLAELAYTVPLRSLVNYSHNFSVRVPLKSIDNTLEFSQIPVTDNETHIVQAELVYEAAWQLSGSRFVYDLSVIASPGGLSGRNEDRFFDISRAGAKADYFIFRANGSFLSALPGGWTWLTQISTQVASNNLLGSEQLDMTGVNAVRSYDNSLLFRDNGVVIRNELSLPTVSVIDALEGGSGAARDSLRVYAFLDAGFANNVDPLPGEIDSVSLGSVGLGLQYNYASYFSASLEYGWQLSDDPEVLRDTSSQLHASIVIGY